MSPRDDDSGAEIQSSKEFSPEERAALRQMLSTMRFRVRVWAGVGVGVKWIFAVAAGLVAIKLLLGEYLRGIVAR